MNDIINDTVFLLILTASEIYHVYPQMVIRMSGSLNNYLEYTRGKVNSVLYGLFFTPLSLIYGLGVSLRNFAYDHGLISSFEPSLPVISIGNITMGGTNKTPFVEMLARKFLTLGLNPGLVTRGYGGKHKDKGPILVVNGKGDRGQVGDESLLLSSRLPGVPVAVSLDRLAALEMLRWENKVDIAISDDTFQHRRMVRDVDIVLIDATCPFGNGKLFPAGALRESPKSLKRAHILVITKADQVKEEALAELISLVRKYASDKPIFTSRLVLERWQKWDGDQFVDTDPLNPDLPVSIFSAIGNPESFRNFIENMGFNVKSEMRYRDHHMYSRKDLDNIARRCKLVGAKVAICTEKDVYNLPQGCLIDIPIYVPSVVTVVSEESRFFETLIETLRPKIVISSNGHGEDSMACLLAERIRKDLPKAKLYAFPLVGKGKIFEDSGIEVYPPPLDTPSGGVIKYSFFELIKDVRAGLIGHVKRQLDAWSRLRGKIRTPICVGDVYLLLHALYGQGMPPLLLATAKTVYLRGHFLIEKQILRKKSRKVWTRDEMTACELRKSSVNAVYVGNPIMDLAGDNDNEACEDPWMDKEGRRILLLPGSRQDAYKDVRLLLKAAELVTKQINANFLMVIAPSIEWDKMASSLKGYLFEDNLLRKGDLEVAISFCPVAVAAKKADLLLGLGGTANQVCAGLGVPVVSVDDKGKRVQKKLLGDAEVLLKRDPQAIASEIISILGDSERHQAMSLAGKERMGEPGAIEDVARYVLCELGWKHRHDLYCALQRKFLYPLESVRKEEVEVSVE